ncbi:MAG: hypothetical protein OXI90_08490 [Gammaproteobacteria bacterium]|nr:hypothetical protein [Gammaproteobacteria bacterium]
MVETDQTAGGFWPILVALVGSYVGQLMVEGLGGADGIDQKLSNLADRVVEAAREPNDPGKHPLY